MREFMFVDRQRSRQYVTYMTPRLAGLLGQAKNRITGKCREREAFHDISVLMILKEISLNERVVAEGGVGARLVGCVSCAAAMEHSQN